jgi:putative peptidoglycan lipid II flippase
VAVSTLDPQPEASSIHVQQEPPEKRGNYWGVGWFRFHFSLENFRPGQGFALRRFSIAEAAFLLMMGILASRGLGVIRQVTFNAVFGTSVPASAYVAAFRMPDTLFNLVAGGTLIHAFVPIFVSFDKDRTEREIWRLASLVFNVMLVTLVVLLVIAEFAAPFFVARFLVPGFSPSEQALTTSLTRIMLVQPLILGLSSIMSGILSSRRQFVLPALAIAVYNVGLIAGLICTLIFPGIGIYGLAFGVLAAAVCHFSVQVPGLVKQKARYFFVWDLKDPGLHAVLRLLIPSLLAAVVASIGSIVDISFTSFFRDKGSIAAINNAELLFALPVALLAQVVARAALPRMSMLALEGQYVHLRRVVIRVVGVAVLLSIPAAIFLAVFGKPVIHLLFQHGAFSRHSSSLVYIALVGYALILPGRVADELINRSFYALRDARTPLLIDILALGVRIGLIVMLVRLLHGKYLLLSVPLAVGGAAAFEALLLGFLLLLRFRTKINMVQPQTVSSVPEEAPPAFNSAIPDIVPEEVSVEPEPELHDGWLEVVKVESEPELPARVQKEVDAEPGQDVSTGNQEELEPSDGNNEQQTKVTASEPNLSAKKRTNNKQGTGKRNRQKKSGRSNPSA